MYRLELRNNQTIDLYDAEGPLLEDIELGWTDTSTGNYVDPNHEFNRWQTLVDAANKGLTL